MSATSGTISFDGKDWTAGSPQQAQRAGISTIFQEINLIGYRSVAENIFLGREPKRGFGLLDWSKMNAEFCVLAGALRCACRRARAA